MSEVERCQVSKRLSRSQIATPLTFQQRFFFAIHRRRDTLNRLDTFALHLSGALNIDRLRRCFDELTRRHDSLRARIVMTDGVPKQETDDSCDPSMEIIRIADVAGGELDLNAQAQRLIQTTAQQRYDLSLGPLFDVKVIKSSELEFLLVWGIHHLISDGTSLSLMFREMWQMYGEFIRGRQPPLKAMPPQFADYRIWQEKTQRVWLAKHRPYWEERLAGAVGIRWPLEGSMPPIVRGPVVVAQISLGETLSARLSQLARDTKTLLSLEMLTVYVAVIAGFCNQKDFIVATTVTGRDRLEHHYVVGYLAHLVYLRIQLTGDETFTELLGRVSQEYCRTLLRKDFGGIVIETPELLAGTLFQWSPWRRGEIDGLPMPAEAARLDIAAEVFPVEQTSNFPEDFNIMVWFSETKEGVSGGVAYRPDVFTANAIERLVQHLRAMAERLGETPHARVMTGFPLLSDTGGMG